MRAHCDVGDQSWKPDGVFATAADRKHEAGVYHTVHAGARPTSHPLFNLRLRYNATDYDQRPGYDVESGASV